MLQPARLEVSATDAALRSIRRHIPAHAEWAAALARAEQVVPEAFGPGHQLLNLIGGRFAHPGHGRVVLSPVDGTALGRLPMIELDTAKQAVAFARSEAAAWANVDLDERRRRVSECLEELRRQCETLALLLVWEIGKPWRLALADVDRCLSGVAWYVEHIETLLRGRTPLGLVSNIASWNYPLSVLVHAVLVQCLAGNSTIAKTPTDGGGFAISVALGVARRHGLPVSLVSGSGSKISDALVRSDCIDCLSFVGGRASGRDIQTSLVDHSKRYMLEMEGVNAYGVWNFSDWGALAAQLSKSYEYGKQRCTAYPRFVVERRLLPKFLETYFGVLGKLSYGHPLLADSDDAALPDLAFGPLINREKVEELALLWNEAVMLGALPVYEGSLGESAFLPGQDISAYFAPRALLAPPRRSRLYHAEPFGPLDTIVAVDGLEELIAEMNVSNGNLVASLATDDQRTASIVKNELRAFKFGENKLRSRGDNEEIFGGLGASWKGCFVGGRYLVEAVTHGPPGAPLYGNFPDLVLLPEQGA